MSGRSSWMANNLQIGTLAAMMSKPPGPSGMIRWRRGERRWIFTAALADPPKPCVDSAINCPSSVCFQESSPRAKPRTAHRFSELE
ncbi:hypothetical protein O181_014512 [Austropuccinia psidii MF-1]|uniref:Uncharacterized protein n=1 Tax=Austropuccinia psidii MF-1 TaxID=1389203 RepID=A0A9Q3C1S5_9BASI|nr:hypothetical protein [Austropuccinia psidii MF-1]